MTLYAKASTIAFIFLCIAATVSPCRAETIPESTSKLAISVLPKNLKDGEHFVIVDKSENVQRMFVATFNASGHEPFSVIKSTTVSTGNDKRRGFFETPTGIFEVLPGASYRAQGTRNAKGVRGLGIKGSRVWDFGWQATFKNGEKHNIRLQMHGTDPDTLETRLGRKDSKGCVRVDTEMNRFLDENGILDAPWHNADKKYLYQLHENQRNHEKRNGRAGRYMVVVDSGEHQS